MMHDNSNTKVTLIIAQTSFFSTDSINPLAPTANNALN